MKDTKSPSTPTPNLGGPSMLPALLTERAGYVTRELPDRVAAVDEQLDARDFGEADRRKAKLPTVDAVRAAAEQRAAAAAGTPTGATGGTRETR